MVSDGDGLGLGAPRRHGIGGQIHEQLDELLVVRDHIEQLHDLHDHVIERLFAAGLDMQGTIAVCRSPEVVERLTGTVDDLQSTIEEIRATVFEWQFPRRLGGDLRQRMQNAVDTLTADRDISTTLRFLGPMSAVGVDLANHVEAVITEALSNALGHCNASHMVIKIAVGDELAIDIIDNGGANLADNQRMATTMQRRAELIGGSCRVAAPPGGGTHLHWTAPLIDP